MSRHNHTPSPEYRKLVGQIESFAETFGHDKVTRAVADGLEETLREQFKKNVGADRRSDGVDCIGRLIAGWDQCRHSTPHADAGDYPCSPPHHDHTDLWLRDGDAIAYSMHLYDLGSDELRDIVEFADTWGVWVRIHAGSWYFPNRTTHVVFYAPERLR